MTEFEPGMLASVPVSGICEVVAVEELEMLGDTHRFIVLDPVEKEGLLKVPEQKAGDRGIRPLSQPEPLEEMLQQDFDSGPPKRLPPHRRIKKWTKTLRNQGLGARLQVLEELRALEDSGLRVTKKERKFGETVRLNCRREMEEVLDLSPCQAGLKIAYALKDD